jgi:hypothetical protein
MSDQERSKMLAMVNDVISMTTTLSMDLLNRFNALLPRCLNSAATDEDFLLLQGVYSEICTHRECTIA